MVRLPASAGAKAATPSEPSCGACKQETQHRLTKAIKNLSFHMPRARFVRGCARHSHSSRVVPVAFWLPMVAEPANGTKPCTVGPGQTPHQWQRVTPSPTLLYDRSRCVSTGLLLSSEAKADTEVRPKLPPVPARAKPQGRTVST